MNYTPNQRQAIQAINQNLQVIAGAGSGKTQVISARIVEILRQRRDDGIRPENIVAFTFTEKAAAELKDRIASLVEEAFGSLTGMAEMYVGTIHGFCLNILQNYLFEFLKYSVLSEVQTRLLISRNSVRSGLSTVEIISGPSAGQRLTRAPRDVRIFLEALNVLREDSPQRDRIPAILWQALEDYESLLDVHRFLDYSRIMVEAVAALYDESEPDRIGLQEKIAQRFKYIIVDEYQDVNPIQEALIRRLHQFGAQICIVGDDDQTIYQWRGSEIRNILEFAQRYPLVLPVTLAENFRSTHGIVDTGRLIAERNNPNRLPKDMIAGSARSFERGDLLALTFRTPEAEAEWIVQKILNLRGASFEDDPGAPPRGLSWSDCAILLRSVRNSGDPIVRALDAAGIPYIITGLSNLFNMPEVHAAGQLFAYIVDDATAEDVRSAWLQANLGLSDADLTAGIAVLDIAKSWRQDKRWSAYNIQRVFLDFLEVIHLREERIPPTNTGEERGEIVFYNLGKFSQVISDFEQIYFKTDPQEKYRSFVWWLRNEAPEYYEEGGSDEGFAEPDAVQIMTVHQAKGMEWPVVFIPALQRNRFPSGAGGKGRSKWHIFPRNAIPDADRYDGSIADERRLFYVAITRSKKYVYCSYSPVPGNQLYQRPSPFFKEFTQSPHVLTREPAHRSVNRLEPRPRRETPKVVLNFSELKYFFECPYSFKLRFLYGFNPPLDEALGFGKSLHDALAEVHKRAIDGDIFDENRAESLIDYHLHLPFAYPELEGHLRNAAINSLRKYLREQGTTLPQTIHSEQQVEIQVVPGITVNGRIDLIKRLDTNEVAIVDFKSSERAQAEDVTRAQLHTYAIGYRQLTGNNADLLEVLNLDEAGRNVREVVDEDLLIATEQTIRDAGDAIRENRMERLVSWCGICKNCDFAGICRTKET
jgi:DNA helicase-2/ATP-dependent DNA helicase PcrA